MSRASKRRIQPKPDLGIPILGFRISVFCQAHGISEDFYFRLQRDGLGPKTMKIGGVTIISVEAAEVWRRDARPPPPRTSGPPGHPYCSFHAGRNGASCTSSKRSEAGPWRRLSLPVARCLRMRSTRSRRSAAAPMRTQSRREEALMRHDHCLIVDVHSFSSVPLSHELDQTRRRGIHPYQPRPFAALQHRPHERAGCAKERAFRE